MDQCWSTNNIPVYQHLEKQEYFDNMPPSMARTLFQLKAGQYDFKASRSYKYEDVICRLCQIHDETIDHVVNHCEKIERDSFIDIVNIHHLSEEETYTMVERVQAFRALIDWTSLDILLFSGTA